MNDVKPPRLASVDLLRGLAMVLMALDHVRYFFFAARFDPLDLTQTTPVLFMTRWITHPCAPVFVFLAGTGAYLSLRRGKTNVELARFLMVRGLWLVFLELTVIRFGWTFDFHYSTVSGLVIWTIGWSMIAMSGLIFLPRTALAVVALGMIALHNLLDGVQPDSLGAFSWLWQILHVQSRIQYAPGHVFFVGYPLVPWIGVMAAGFLLGDILKEEEGRRRKILTGLGLALMAAFIVLRATNLYGDQHPWVVGRDAVTTFLSFINTSKYPASLLYLLMTLGPAIAMLPLLERWKGRIPDFFIVFGRVPLFYYVIHIPLIHFLAAFVARLARFAPASLFSTALPAPRSDQFPLAGVYLVWIAVILMLYYPCRWFAGVKKRRKDVWLSYL